MKALILLMADIRLSPIKACSRQDEWLEHASTCSTLDQLDTKIHPEQMRQVLQLPV
jgi:hypothetical protein